MYGSIYFLSTSARGAVLRSFCAFLFLSLFHRRFLARARARLFFLQGRDRGEEAEECKIARIEQIFAGIGFAGGEREM